MIQSERLLTRPESPQGDKNNEPTLLEQELEWYCNPGRAYNERLLLVVCTGCMEPVNDYLNRLKEHYPAEQETLEKFIGRHYDPSATQQTEVDPTLMRVLNRIPEFQNEQFLPLHQRLLQRVDYLYHIEIRNFREFFDKNKKFIIILPEMR